MANKPKFKEVEKICRNCPSHACMQAFISLVDSNNASMPHQLFVFWILTGSSFCWLWAWQGPARFACKYSSWAIRLRWAESPRAHGMSSAPHHSPPPMLTLLPSSLQKQQKLECGHEFHKTCIDHWLLRDKPQSRCPLCLRQYNAHSS